MNEGGGEEWVRAKEREGRRWRRRRDEGKLEATGCYRGYEGETIIRSH